MAEQVILVVDRFEGKVEQSCFAVNYRVTKKITKPLQVWQTLSEPLKSIRTQS